MRTNVRLESNRNQEPKEEFSGGLKRDYGWRFNFHCAYRFSDHIAIERVNLLGVGISAVNLQTALDDDDDVRGWRKGRVRVTRAHNVPGFKSAVDFEQQLN
jgi:hypothetical protein